MKRHEAREKAFQILFQLDVNDNEPEQAISNFLESAQNNDFMDLLVNGVAEHKEELDTIIANNLEHWSLERIASVERTIIRIAVFEINFLEDIPTSVSINEAIELANLYGDEKSGKFVNGVLSKIIV